MDQSRGLEFEKIKHQVSKKTNELYKIGKLNLTLNNAYSELDELYQKLGELIYLKRITHVDQSEEAGRLLQDITNQLHEVKRIEQAIANVKNDRVCPYCQHRISSKEKYCPNCYAPLRE